MTSPDQAIPTGAYTTTTINQLQNVSQSTIAQAKVKDLTDTLNHMEQAFFNGLLGGFGNIPQMIASAINQFISNLVYALKNATGGFVDLTGFLSNVNAISTSAASQANAAQGTATAAQGTATAAGSAAAAAQTTANSKPNITDLALTANSLWMSINVNEDTTFPRTLLSAGAAPSTTSGGSGTSSHSHGLSQIPQYQPAGNGGNNLELAYIRSAKNRSYTQIGFITGGSATFAGITHFFVGLYSVNTSTGGLTLVNTVSAGTDWASSISNTNTEYRLSMGQTITANQNDIWAVGLLQVTGVFQTCSSLLDTTLSNINPPVTQFPRKNYCYNGSVSTLPSTIAESSLNYSNSTLLPFYALRE